MPSKLKTEKSLKPHPKIKKRQKVFDPTKNTQCEIDLDALPFPPKQKDVPLFRKPQPVPEPITSLVDVQDHDINLLLLQDEFLFLEPSKKVQCRYCLDIIEKHHCVVPYRYRRKTKKFECIGFTCSWNCSVSHMAERKWNVDLLRQLLSKIYGQTIVRMPKPSPNKNLLNIWTGTGLSREEYRSLLDNKLPGYDLSMAPVIPTLTMAFRKEVTPIPVKKETPEPKQINITTEQVVKESKPKPMKFKMYKSKRK